MFSGDVANDVETEQIVWDMNSAASIAKGRFSAFVQRRGSVSHFNSLQSISSNHQNDMIPLVIGSPPLVSRSFNERSSGKATHSHWYSWTTRADCWSTFRVRNWLRVCRGRVVNCRDLKKKYGDPVVVMNLVKKREKRRGDENLLHEQFIKVLFHRPSNLWSHFYFSLFVISINSFLFLNGFATFPSMLPDAINRLPLLPMSLPNWRNLERKLSVRVHGSRWVL